MKNPGQITIISYLQSVLFDSVPHVVRFLHETESSDQQSRSKKPVEKTPFPGIQGDDLITLWVATCRANMKIDHCRGARACYSTPLFRHFPPLRPLTNTYFHLHILPVPTWNNCGILERKKKYSQEQLQPFMSAFTHASVHVPLSFWYHRQ